MDRLADLAKRHTSALAGGTLETLVRGIGEAKSKAEEDAIVRRMIRMCKHQIKEGLSRKGDGTKSLKDLLVYLIYIDMLGHETSWAGATIIQLCSHKSLIVKKAAYLATSLLIDPASDLTIMVTATIQADLKSDNFLVVCTALQAISRCTGPELVSVFLPQVLTAMRHDRDLVKKKALLAVHRLLQLDPGIAPDVERPLVEKLGYKEPSVMVAALCALHELARMNPTPYRNLVHYFTNILKQAAEGKLGRAWDYHRAPAPFVQIELLRLLALLGAGDPATTANIQSVIMDVWRRADNLASGVGNVLVFECMRAATTLAPTDTLLSAALHSVVRFLPSTENNLKYAGIDILSRLVGGDAGRVEQHQVAIVQCLRSPDATLKRKTLELLFKMANVGNVEVIADEVLSYVTDSGDDDDARRGAAANLLTVAERLAPSLEWFVDIVTQLLEEGGDIAPPAAADALLRVVACHGDDSSLQGRDNSTLRFAIARRYLALLDRPKLPSALLRVVCWVVGEYGLQTDLDFEMIVEKIAAIPETQAANANVLAAAAAALGKLAVRAGRQLPEEGDALLNTLAKSEALEVQQVATEVLAILRAAPATQRAAFLMDIQPLSTSKKTSIDPNLPFLDDFVHAAEAGGAPPYLSLQDRIAMGVSRADDGGFSTGLQLHGPLKFRAYEATAAPTLPTVPSAISGPTETPAQSSSLFEGLDLGDVMSVKDQFSKTGEIPEKGLPSAKPPTAPSGYEQQLRFNKAGRKWGPAASVDAIPSLGLQTSTAASNSSPGPTSSASGPTQRRSHTVSEVLKPQTAIDPAQQRLAASLFGKRGSTPSSERVTSMARPAAKTVEAPDLLGEFTAEVPPSADSDSRAQPVPVDPLEALAGLDASMLDQPNAMNAVPAFPDFGSDGLLAPSPVAGPPRPRPASASKRTDPFANLLD